jgi:hypothetical protein
MVLTASLNSSDGLLCPIGMIIYFSVCVISQVFVLDEPFFCSSACLAPFFNTDRAKAAVLFPALFAALRKDPGLRIACFIQFFAIHTTLSVMFWL